MKVNGTMINYYFHCKRQCWLFANRINLEDNSEDVHIGRVLHELKYNGNENAEVSIENIKVDKITNDYLVEIKKSDADVKAAKWQTLLYLKILKEKGIAKAIVLGIAENIYEVLYHYYKHGKKELKEFLYWLKEDIPNFLDKDLDIKHILFIEGQIWMKFYDSFKYFLPEDFVMNKRAKRPPDNPINALVSFGNSILYSRTITQIYNTHLNQTISFLHEPRESRFSLSLDLSEVFKPVVVYKSIFELVNNRKIQVDKHFVKKFNYCLLNDSGKKIFIESIENRFNNVFEHKILKRKISYETAIKLDGYKLIKYCMEGKKFKPFSLKEMM